MASRRILKNKKRKNPSESSKPKQKVPSLKNSDYKKIYEKSPTLQLITNTKGIILSYNDAYASSLGYEKKEIIGKSIFTHVPKENLAAMQESFQRWKNTRQVSQREIWIKRKDGSIFPALLTGGSLYDSQGNITGRTVALMDLTEIYNTKTKLEENEKQLRSQYEELQKLNSLKDDFLTMITHELKTPLVPIKGYIDILISEKLGTLNPEQLKRIKIVKSSTDSLLKLISDLLDAQKLELGLLRMNKDIHDLSEIIRNTANKLKPTTEKKGIVVTTHLEDSLPFFCDQLRMEQIISNLINNSVDFCIPDTGRIDISLQDKGSDIKIIVKDNGVGISKESLDKIFVKFFQVDTSMTREHGGTGIGLSVCRGIVEGHGGKIWAESEGRDKGAEIHMLLPKFR